MVDVNEKIKRVNTRETADGVEWDDESCPDLT